MRVRAVLRGSGLLRVRGVVRCGAVSVGGAIPVLLLLLLLLLMYVRVLVGSLCCLRGRSCVGATVDGRTLHSSRRSATVLRYHECIGSAAPAPGCRGAGARGRTGRSLHSLVMTHLERTPVPTN